MAQKKVIHDILHVGGVEGNMDRRLLLRPGRQ